MSLSHRTGGNIEQSHGVLCQLRLVVLWHNQDDKRPPPGLGLAPPVNAGDRGRFTTL